MTGRLLRAGRRNEGGVTPALCALLVPSCVCAHAASASRNLHLMFKACAAGVPSHASGNVSAREVSYQLCGEIGPFVWAPCYYSMYYYSKDTDDPLGVPLRGRATRRLGTGERV